MAFKGITPEDLFGAMTRVRASNNDLWMQLAYIAYKHEPKTVKNIIERISTNDTAVVDLWKELANASNDPD